MENQLKIFMVSAFALISTLSHSQYSIGGGMSTFHGAGIDITRYGVNLYYETPRTEVNTFYFRPTLMIPQKNSNITSVEANSFGVSPQKLEGVRVIDKTSYFSVDGGTRIYFLNTYSGGISLYGGGHLKGIISAYSREYDISDGSIDPQDYDIQNIGPDPALLFSFGGNFGAKYQLPYRGAIVFDIAVDLISGIYDPQNILGNEISALSISFNLAYRFDWY